MPHRIRSSDTDEHVVEQRAEEQSKRAKVDRFIAQYGRIFLATAIAVSTWFMAHIVQPLNQVPHLVRVTDSLTTSHIDMSKKFDSINAKLDEGRVDRSRMVDILAVLASLQCDQFTSRERRTSILCGKLQQGQLP